MLSFSNFHRLDPVARDVTLELLRRSRRGRPSFISFIYRWMAFNGWMSAVTLLDTDAAMIRACAADDRLTGAYDELMAASPEFRQEVMDFAALWPVLKVSSVRAKLGYDAFRQHDRAALLALCAAANVRQQPAIWVAGAVPNWEQVLRTIYQVRCNLFHGEKSPQAPRDWDLVLASNRILRRFTTESRCFDWNDA